MPYQHHPARPLTPESSLDKWAEKPTVKEAAKCGLFFFLIVMAAQVVWLVTGA
jgi:hypothetical protein